MFSVPSRLKDEIHDFQFHLKQQLRDQVYDEALIVYFHESRIASHTVCSLLQFAKRLKTDATAEMVERKSRRDPNNPSLF